ncbi:hypothetical protein [Aeromonas sp. MrichA-1]|uniref:hypothetical protein n=1 Tax=Aeromonas sp. MrichA-1 TaxID=2823362 RepID=UPI001B3293C1|nr:hypothetical protein [Aeromonas sp. MrichA-1]MBP4081862.1 hypothetical protein [Aeromonas sp. MrichA-1]
MTDVKVDEQTEVKDIDFGAFDDLDISDDEIVPNEAIYGPSDDDNDCGDACKI